MKMSVGNGQSVVLTSASCLAPYARRKAEDRWGDCSTSALLPGVSITIVQEGESGSVYSEESVSLIAVCSVEVSKKCSERLCNGGALAPGWAVSRRDGSGAGGGGWKGREAGRQDANKEEDSVTLFLEEVAVLVSEGAFSHANRHELLRICAYQLCLSETSTPHIGQTVHIISSPYGSLSPPMFYNSYTRGVISNIMTHCESKPNTVKDENGESVPALLMMDARCLAGCEGAPVLSSAQEGSWSRSGPSAFPLSSFLGLVTIPLHCGRLQHDLTFAIPALALRNTLLESADVIFDNSSTLSPALVSAPHPNSYVFPVNTSCQFTQTDHSISSLNRERISVPSQSLYESLDGGAGSHDALRSSIVLIAVGGHWGSGILLSAPALGANTYAVVTNAHLFDAFLARQPRKALLAAERGQRDSQRGGGADSSDALVMQMRELGPQVRVRVKTGMERDPDGFTWVAAQPLFLSPSHVDIAVLSLSFRTRRATFPPLYPDQPTIKLSQPLDLMEELGRYRIQVGELVHVIGHGVFGPSVGMSHPTITTGVLSRVATWEGRDAVLQVTALVHEGNSGGALFGSDGRLIGVVVCNATQRDGSCVPSLGFAIPLSALSPVAAFLSSGMLDQLKGLEVFDPQQHCAMWQWGEWHPSQSPLSPRGSKFRTFLEELRISSAL